MCPMTLPLSQTATTEVFTGDLKNCNYCNYLFADVFTLAVAITIATGSAHFADPRSGLSWPVWLG